jgi:7-cyano-7-deazaguanine synthase
MNKQAVLSLSGGMDSSTLLLHLLADGYEVTCLSFDYGQKHNIELERAKELVKYLNNHSRYEDEQYYAKVKHQVITLKGLDKLLNSALVKGGADVPEGHYAEDNMKATVVPNRNKIFSSIIQAVALSIADEKNTEVKIAMGIHAGDHAIYPDCRQEFRDIDYDAFCAGNWGADRVQYYTPYLSDDKVGILKDGEKCCTYLHLNFDKVYAKTNTSYKPIKHKIEFNNATETWYEEEWFSDYKSASSVERVEAFMKLGRKDPVQYADEYGPVTWEYVKEFVSCVLENYEDAKTTNI